MLARCVLEFDDCQRVLGDALGFAFAVIDEPIGFIDDGAQMSTVSCVVWASVTRQSALCVDYDYISGVAR